MMSTIIVVAMIAVVLCFIRSSWRWSFTKASRGPCLRRCGTFLARERTPPSRGRAMMRSSSPHPSHTLRLTWSNCSLIWGLVPVCAPSHALPLCLLPQTLQPADARAHSAHSLTPHQSGAMLHNALALMRVETPVQRTSRCHNRLYFLIGFFATSRPRTHTHTHTHARTTTTTTTSSSTRLHCRPHFAFRCHRGMQVSTRRARPRHVRRTRSQHGGDVRRWVLISRLVYASRHQAHGFSAAVGSAQREWRRDGARTQLSAQH